MRQVTPLILGVILAGWGLGQAEEKKASDPVSTVLHYTREGGFAGYADDLTIRSDFSYTHAYWGRTLTGKLSPEQTERLKQLLKRYGKTTWRRKDPPDPDVADAIVESLLLNGTGDKTKLEGQELKEILSLVGSLRDPSYKQSQPKKGSAQPAK